MKAINLAISILIFILIGIVPLICLAIVISTYTLHPFAGWYLIVALWLNVGTAYFVSSNFYWWFNKQIR